MSWLITLSAAGIVLYLLFVMVRLGLFERLALAFAPISLDTIPDRAAARLGDSPLFTTDEPCDWTVPSLAALHPDPGAWSADRIRATADHVGALLVQLGLKTGDRAVVLKRNHLDMHVFAAAIVRAGGVACPVNNRLDAADVSRYIDSLDARILITDVETLRRISPCDLPGVAHVVIAGRRTANGVSAATLLRGASPHTTLHWIEEALERVTTPLTPAARTPDEVCYIVHSSGTTGFPKPVMLTNGAQSQAVRGWLAYVHLSPRFDHGYLAVPNNHQAVMLTFHGALLLGLRIHWHCAYHVSGFDPRHVVRELADGRFTGYFGFPITYTQLKEVDLSRFDLRTMRFWATTADASHEVIQRKFAAVGGAWRALGIPIDGSVFMDAQGSSEVGTPSVLRYVTRFTRRFGRRIGLPGSTPFGPDLRIVDGNGNAVRDGDAGRLEVRGPTVFAGYLNDPEHTARVKRDGWFFTGDVVRRDADGNLIQLDREVDVIRTADGPVYSLPIEEVVHMHPAVFDACVYGRCQADGSQLPAAAIALRAGQSIAAATLRNEINAKLPAGDQLCVVEIMPWSRFPIGVTGKTLKRVFREQHRLPALTAKSRSRTGQSTGFARALLLLLACIPLASCVIRVNDPKIESVERPAADVMIRTPVKAHMFNGDIVLFRNGATVTRDNVNGIGVRYAYTLRDSSAAASIPLDSVIGLESFSLERDGARTRAYSVLPTLAGTALVAGGALALFKAIFGSCPTVYVDSAGVEALQAESFSYSIAPLYESRDVDRLAASPGADGRLWVRIRNEALETHYINHLELLQVRHGEGERALPDEKGVPVVVASERTARHARDAAGRDLAVTLRATDGNVFSSDAAYVADAAARGFDDRIDLSFDRPAGHDSVTLVLRMRNSLLNTVLFYDVMLGSAGPSAVNWLGTDLETIGTATETGLWYRARSGMRVSVRENGVYRAIGRIGDAGPIADKDVAIVIPAGRGDRIDVRLDFLADLWRIDRVALGTASRGTTSVIPPVALTDVSESHDASAMSRALHSDGRYLVTYPGDWFRIGFDAPELEASSGARYTYMLAAQGYYTEWVRNDWLRNDDPVKFAPGDGALTAAYSLWQKRQPEMELHFFQNRVHGRVR